MNDDNYSCKNRNRVHFFVRYRILLITILYSLLLTGCRQQADLSENKSNHIDFNNKRVLMISSYSPAFRTYYQQIEGVKSVFNSYSIQLDNEFMDTKRFYTEENFKLFLEYLSYKISHVAPYDAVIIADDDALNLVMEHRQELFVNTPIFFLGVNNYENALKYSKENKVTGVFEAPSYHDTLQLAYDLNPDAKRVVGLVDATASGQGDAELFLAEQTNFESLEFETMDLSNITFHEFEERLASISKDDIVVLISVYRDYEGTTYTFEQGLKIVLDHLQAPLYHTYEHGLGEGVLGGKVVSHTKQGESAAQLVMEYFQGTSLSEIPLVDTSPNQYMIDWEVFNSYDLNQSQLPVETKFINKEDTFIDKYGKMIGITFLIFMAESFMITALFYLLQSSKRARNKLQMINEELTCLVETVEARDNQIRNLIYIDNLTGLNNRFALYETIEQRILTHQDEAFVVMFLDVDNFKNVNDLFGHDIGDELIKETGQQFRNLLSQDIQAGRFGGDEFIFIILKQWNDDQIIDYVEKVRMIFRECLKLKDQLFYLTISIGVAKYPEHGKTKEELIKKADIALYEAKKNGKDQYVIYDAHMDEVLSEQLIFQEMLRSAFNNNEFELYYQPLFRFSDDTIIGFEALIRWHNEQLGWVSPYRMITVAEEMGLIIQLGEWIFTEAVKYAKTINQLSKSIVSVSINISTIQLAYTGFYDFVMATVKKYGVDPKCICLEMTETVFMKREDEGYQVLNKLSLEGFGISLDDFGTGYSSLSYLKQFKINLLKIDQSFIDNFVQDAYDQKLVELVIEIAKQKSTYVLAEGVERKEQFELLKSMDCDMIQGYYISKPLPAKDAILFLKSNLTND